MEASATNTLGATALALPNGTSTNLNSSDNKRFEFEAKLDTLQQLVGAYPDGNYTFRITTKNQGLRSPTIPLNGDVYPSIPQFKNVDAALAIDPKQDFILEWQPFIGATSSDFIHLQIEDSTGTKVMESADFAKADALSGLKIFAKIHDGTLLPGTTYTAKLLFVRISAFDTAMYPGALGAAGFGRETHLQIRTSGTRPAAPSLTAVRLSGNQGIQLLVNGAAGLTYRIEASTGFPNWLTIGTVTLTTGQADFTDSISPSSAYRFYRAVRF